jgi:DNA-binding NtrC family response regulator
VLQERSFTAVGGREKKRFGGRVIAATNQPLGALRRGGRFRNDFFYRLCSDVIEVPTLRQRIAESEAELELLVRLLVARIAGAEVPELVTRVLEALYANLPRGYPWPGNVRELEQAVRRILLTGGRRRGGCPGRQTARRSAQRGRASGPLQRPALPQAGQLRRSRQAHRARSAHRAQVRGERKIRIDFSRPARYSGATG